MSERKVDTKSVEDIVKQVSQIADLTPDQDFYDAGMTSLVSLTLLLELEGAFDLSIPDERFIACRSINDLVRLIQGCE